MMQTTCRPPLLLAAFLLAALFFSAQPAVALECSGCHFALLKGKNVHPATESCDACHEAVTTPHPQKGQKTFKLAAEQPALCANCHEPLGTKKVVHPPVQDTCTTCHNPHSSDQPKLLLQPIGELCTTCHSDKNSFKVLHGPVSAGDCTTCHSPHESDNKSLLVTAGDALCFSCHGDIQDLVKKKVLHPALEGGCTSCHNPHGAEHPKLLAAAGQELCFGCHDTIGEKVTKAAFPHPALQGEKGCASCHSPHAADNPKLLLKPEKDTCLSCHGQILTRAMTVLHGPIEAGGCTPCHDPHGSRNTKLLVASFPADPYAPYTDKTYELCFGCHDKGLLQYPDTSFATGFRDGERNLHYLHVNRPKGRSCLLCHAPHGATNGKMIADSVPFGKWQLPLKFVKTETGGGCTPGCHRPQVYDRQNPGQKPPPRPSKG